MKKFKFKLKQHRKNLGLSLDKLAKESGTSKSYLWELENSDREISARLLYRVSKALGVDMEYLIDDNMDFGENTIDAKVEALHNVFSKIESILDDVRPSTYIITEIDRIDALTIEAEIKREG